MFQQPLLGRQPAGKTGQRAIAANHAMTRDDDRDRVTSIRRAHRPRGLGPVNLLRDLPVTGGGRIGNGCQRPPYRLLKLCAQWLERQIENQACSQKYSSS